MNSLRGHARTQAALESVLREEPSDLANGVGQRSGVRRSKRWAAGDLVQEVFLTFVATLDRFEGRASVQTWLYGILLRKAKERWRVRAKEATDDAIDDEWNARGNPGLCGGAARAPAERAFWT